MEEEIPRLFGLYQKMFLELMHVSIESKAMSKAILEDYIILVAKLENSTTDEVRKRIMAEFERHANEKLSEFKKSILEDETVSDQSENSQKED